MKLSLAVVSGSIVIMAGCAGALGRGGPEARAALAVRVPAAMTAEDLGARIRQGGYEFVMLSSERDSAWLASVAAQAGLQMTRPGNVGGATYAFLGPKALGDTTHTLRLTGGGQVRLHDALFRVDKNRQLDLILARFDGVANLGEAVRSLLAYVAKDVSGNAALLLGVEGPTPQIGDSVAVLLRAAYTDTRECNGGASGAPTSIRLLYGPEARIRCERASVLIDAGGAVAGQFVLP